MGKGTPAQLALTRTYKGESMNALKVTISKSACTIAQGAVKHTCTLVPATSANSKYAHFSLTIPNADNAPLFRAECYAPLTQTKAATYTCEPRGTSKVGSKLFGFGTRGDGANGTLWMPNLTARATASAVKPTTAYKAGKASKKATAKTASAPTLEARMARIEALLEKLAQ